MKPMVEKPEVDSCVPHAPDDEWTDGGLVYAPQSTENSYKHAANHAPATPPVVLKPKARAPVVEEKQEHSTTDSNWPAGGGPLGTGSLHCRLPHAELEFANTMPWKSWKEVPEPDALPAHISGGFFLEMFAGTAHLTLAMRAHRSPVPPTHREEQKERDGSNPRTPSSTCQKFTDGFRRAGSTCSILGQNARHSPKLANTTEWHHQFDAHTHSRLWRHAQQRSVPEWRWVPRWQRSPSTSQSAWASSGDMDAGEPTQLHDLENEGSTAYAQ